MRSADWHRPINADAAALLAAWETGAATAPLDRAPSLLTSLDLLVDEDQLDALTVGACDSRLLALRRHLFGDSLEAVSECPHCGEEIDVELPLAELQPAPNAAQPTHVHVSEQSYRIDCRPLRNADLRALQALAEAPELGDVAARCVIEARDPTGTRVSARELPADVAEAVLREAAACDPGAQLTVTVVCPCGHSWAAEVDIRAILWTELTDWVGRTLSEVHALARAYGWSEGDILAMSAWRRRWYLEAAGW